MSQTSRSFVTFVRDDPFDAEILFSPNAIWAVVGSKAKKVENKNEQKLGSSINEKKNYLPGGSRFPTPSVMLTL